ncbi:MAG: hypothetical protein DHS20C15_27570 [Planctomycetota bacterium]|nr:MAG: hypothetical protein DHS20C15_27570 [Planctomycetota bacterium]
MSKTRLPEHRSQAGAVNALWVIVLMILLGAAIALFFTSQSQISELQADVAEANAARRDADARFEEKNTAHRDLSAAVGFRDESDFASTSDATAIRNEVDETIKLLGLVAGAEGDEPSLQKLIDNLQAAVSSARNAEAAAKSQAESELAARIAANQRSTDLEDTYKSQIDAKDSEIADLSEQIASDADDMQRRLDDIIAQQESDDQARRDAEQALEDLQESTAKATAQNAAQLKAIAMRRQQPEPDRPDGEILAVADTGGQAWINVGGMHGLRVGTRFEVLRANESGALSQRGIVEVREVDTDMARVGLVGTPDPFDPIIAGDLVSNPHFSKNESLRFHLLGQFPLTLSKEFVTQRLEDLGSAVDEKISSATDVLVLGDKDLSEGEFATELTDTDEYHLADKLGMRIIRLDELASFLRY